MTFHDIHREEARKVGEPADDSVAEVAGIAPPCDDCGEKPAVAKANNRDLCGDCHPDDSL